MGSLEHSPWQQLTLTSCGQSLLLHYPLLGLSSRHLPVGGSGLQLAHQQLKAVHLHQTLHSSTLQCLESWGMGSHHEKWGFVWLYKRIWVDIDLFAVCLYVVSSSLRVQYGIFATFLRALIPASPNVLWMILGDWFPQRGRGAEWHLAVLPCSQHCSIRGCWASGAAASASCRFSSLKQICSNQQFPVSRGTQLRVSGSLLVFLSWKLFPTQQKWKRKKKKKKARAKPHTLQEIPFFSVSPEPVQCPSACYHFCPAWWALSEK